MAKVKAKEKRDAVLYAKVKPSNKAFIKKHAKTQGYSTLSEYMDKWLEAEKEAVEGKK